MVTAFALVLMYVENYLVVETKIASDKQQRSESKSELEQETSKDDTMEKMESSSSFIGNIMERMNSSASFMIDRESLSVVRGGPMNAANDDIESQKTISSSSSLSSSSSKCDKLEISNACANPD